MIQGSEHRFSPRQRRWGRISWWYSLILPAALLFLLIYVAVGHFGSDPAFVGTVKNAYTGDPVKGAEIEIRGVDPAITDDRGHFSFDAPVSGSLIITDAEFEPTVVTVGPGRETIEVMMRPTTLSGVVTSSRTNKPMPGVTVVSSGTDASSVTTVTNEDGRYILADVPPNATIIVTGDDFSEVSKPVDKHVVLNFDIRPDVLAGTVTDANGAPIAGAAVRVGTESTTTSDDGTYRLGNAPEQGTIVVKKSGYGEQIGQLTQDLQFDATLSRFTVQALYVDSETAANDQRWQDILNLADTTNVNSVVLDVKDDSGQIHFGSSAPLAKEIGAISASYDLQKRISDLKDHDIYAIARLVVFDDPILAGARPELAVLDASTGEPWTTWDGLQWVNPFKSEVWQYNIDLATELANLGFDEIQLDYLRFPTDGPLALADYGAEVTPESRTSTIASFLEQMQAALAPTGAYLAGDILGVTLWDETDVGIGQQLEALEPYLDIICPEVYPSHFSPGQFGFDFPGDHPFEVVSSVMQRGTERLGAKGFKLRPWLQDFSYGPGITYDATEVQAQLDALNAFDSPGWMLWNADSTYSKGALTASAPA